LSLKKYRKRLLIEEKKKQNSVRFAARSELLLPEESGYLEADDNEKTYQITQKEIVNSVDITSATKHFDLNLEQLGPYFVNYYRNGRNLLIGGKGGHVAAIDWITKDLICEFNVQESVHDIQWLHMPTMFAVAQKDWVYIYDNKGIQIHCLKKLYRVYKLDFLPYHFLLVSASDNGYLSWLDVSMGKMVSNLKMKCPRLTTMKQNPYNAIIATGHPNGTVNMWSPNQKEALVSMLCHPSAVRDIAFDERGLFMATAGVDRALRIWDIRNFKCLQNYKLRSVPSHIDISQRNLLAVSTGNVVEIYNQCFRQTVDTPYMRHRLNANVSGLEFCNYEDVLGIGHQKGFTSIIIPGSGEPNFDAFESNPYMTTSQRREMEVKSLLEKIQPELITLDPMILGTVDSLSLQQQINDKQSVRYVKPKSIEFEAKRKKRMKTAKKAKVKKGLQQQQKRKEIKEIVKEKVNKKSTEKIQNSNEVKNKHVLDRFKSKN
jgi:U3 small nucleolar RNA-associated protein 7